MEYLCIQVIQKILPICLVGTIAMIFIGYISHNAIEAIVIVSANGDCKIFWMR